MPVDEAQPNPPCTSTVTGSAPGPLVAHICGGPLGDVVADGAGHILASNTNLNEIEVLDLATDTLESPIPVGSQPGALALSPDKKTLYVADTGSEEISVVDLAQRSETGRIAAVANAFETDTVASVAVADNGKALVSTSYPGYGTAPPLFEVDLQTGASHLRTAGSVSGSGFATLLAASVDGSKIAVEQWKGEIYLYDAATDTFGPLQGFYTGGDLAFNPNGTKLLVNPTSDIPNPVTLELDDGLGQVAAIPGAGSGLTISPDGSAAYRVDDTRVDVINMASHAVVGAVPLPEALGDAPGAVAVSGDGSQLAVLTQSGISVVSATPDPQTTPELSAMASPAAGVPNTTVSDTATLTGSSNATGTITFSLWGPSSTPNVPCSGYAPYVATKTVTGDGTYQSGGYSISEPGYYSWVAEYSGDNANSVAGPTDCGGPGSTVSIGLPHLTLHVSTNVGSGPFPLPVTYTYTVANDGDDPVNSVAVIDSACGPAGFSGGSTNPAGQLQPGTAWNFSCTHTFDQPGTFVGSASVSASDPDGVGSPTPVSAGASDSVQAVCGRVVTGTVAGDLSVGAGATCLEGAQIHGNVGVLPGGALFATGSVIRGSLGAVEAFDVTVCGTSVGGDVVLEYGLGNLALGHPGVAGNPIAPPCLGDAIGSSVVALANVEGLNVTGSAIAQSVIVWGTSGGLGTQLGNDTIGSALWCYGNSPAANDGALPNIVKGARYGQCSAPSF